MSPRLAVFGAGPGLGLATGRRFGREGFAVTLLARRAERLDGFARELRAKGIEADAHPADLADRATHEGLLAELGPVDVAVLHGLLDPGLVRPVLEVDTENLLAAMNGALLAPHSLSRLLIEGGARTVLHGLGASAALPMAELGGYGIAGAGLRNYIHAAHGALAEHGVHLAALLIGGVVGRSDVAAQFDSSGVPATGRLDPDELAERYWRMHTERDRIEERAGPYAEGVNVRR
ncbi:SDR family NAD(P)-dependent oxidoreductase [Sciscionella marina]|uniref:SDR family NAD(P)-dependent oxidoreductase n=1 Tax=Sciscionella marina TaxID=508770 RepID=UPI0012F694E4|nr:SDR family NAD(P)-dependent oxidoreductase [Sciscionella marina]